ncbi:MAG TPA: cysteine desulfurase family protein [Alphaproteobacteria bacterium]|nr:cysteine desulfurase family protein [Alphaproteobacteria bacterium]
MANRRRVYLDYNATAPLRAEAREAVALALAETGNPSSVHWYGRGARRRVEEARAQVAALLHAEAAEIIFTSGGTEANNLALAGCARPRLLVSDIEHDSVLAAAPLAERIPVDDRGLVRLDVLEAKLAADPRLSLVSVMLANNETGVIQPLAELAALAHARGALVHCDAVQAVGKISVDFAALGVDLLSFSAHKIGGPPGIGALAIRPNLALHPLIRGGGQEKGRRSGTENLPGIVGFGAAAAVASAALANYARLAAWRDHLERGVRAIAPRAQFFGQSAPRLPNTACFTMPGVASETQVMALDLAGVAVSAGSACSSGKVRPSHVLRAMGADNVAAGSAIRVSLGWESQAGDVDRFLNAWASLYARAGNRAA